MDSLDPAARSVLAEGRQLHVGVLTTRGPHVTPELYSFDDRHLWFLTAADTLKTRVVRRDPRAAALVRVGSRAALVAGDVTTYDVGDPMRLLAQRRDALRALAALTSFTIRNAADLVAFARDLAAGRLPSRLPPRRVLLRLRPDRALLLDGSAPLEGDVDCVIGAETDEGIAVLPGRCDAALDRATVPAAAVEQTRVETGRELRGCLVVDDYAAPGPAAKSGALLRGNVGVTLDGALARVAVEADRKTTWDGMQTATVATG